MVSIKPIIFVISGICVAIALILGSVMPAALTPNGVSTLSDSTDSPLGNDTSIIGSATSSKNNSTLSIAYVRPVFTDTAYHHAFYKFYLKYGKVAEEAQITKDIKLLTPEIYDIKKVGTRIAGYLDHLQDLDAKVSILNDMDLHNHDGNILLNGNGSGMRYDIVMLGHQEYVTQKEYDVLKEYVSEGGILVVLNGNVLYAEVQYDKDGKTIQLVKGHGWEFDGVSAKKGVGERWAEETSQWLGSNYLCSSCKITFENNSFEYKHKEEQYVTNPEANIILDYGATVGQLENHDKIIATYELDYNKGKVIVMGIYAEQVLTEENFREFLDGILETHAGLALK